MLRQLKKKVEKMERRGEERRDFKSAGLREQVKHAYELMDWQNIDLKDELESHLRLSQGLWSRFWQEVCTC